MGNVLQLGGADRLENRVNGIFELTAEKANGKHTWKRKDNEENTIIIWFNPKEGGADDVDKNVWMISRKSHINTQSAYACAEVDAETTCPSDVTGFWSIWDMNESKFIPRELKITQNAQ